MWAMQIAAETQGGRTNAVDEIWSLLRMLFGQHRRAFLIAASELELHPAQAGALMQLSSPLPMSELASRLGCDSSNVTGLVDRLEAGKLVARESSVANTVKGISNAFHLYANFNGRTIRSIPCPAGISIL